MNRKRLSKRPHKPKAGTLSEKTVSSDPFDQFNSWFHAAVKAKIKKPEAMTLATSSAGGVLSARIVLFKGIGNRGFSFYTNYLSVKGEQLSQNPRAALVFYWARLDRQIRIEGTVEKMSREESRKYFGSRPRNSQIGAWASQQSQVISSRHILDAQFEKYKQQFRNDDVPLPDQWGGYRLMPSRIEFWQSGANRLHDRILYERYGNSWKIIRLSP
jgi:pyridoxamine 5'-phosphate oxidase